MSSKDTLITKDYTDAQTMRDRLNEISPSMCLAKWLQVSMHLTNGLTQSCYHPPTHKVSLDELKTSPKALHNTQIKIEERKQMREGVRPKGCEYCWKIEDTPGNFLSDRALRSSEPWAQEGFDEVVNNPYDFPINPRYVEVNFNHACNFKCAYCSPHISSSWAQEMEKEGPFPTIVPHNDISYFRSQNLMPIVRKGDNPYVEAFWKWWPELYKDIKVFRMTGGEPLLDKNTHRVLDWIIEHPRPDLELAITSNMCPPPELMDKFLDKLKHIMSKGKIKRFMLFPSIDTWGQQAEYIRTGLDFELFWSNVHRYLKEVPYGLVNFIVTMNLLSAPQLKQLLVGVLELQEQHNKDHHRIFIDTPFLRYPNWMTLQILPKEHHHYLDESVQFMKDKAEKSDRLWGFRDTWIEKLERTTSWGKQSLDPDNLFTQQVNFYRFFKEFDRRRNTDFLKTFPELENFWLLCQKASDRYSQIHENNKENKNESIPQDHV